MGAGLHFALILVILDDLCLSKTAGQTAVGGKMKLANFPRLHSAFALDAHRLCNYKLQKLLIFQFFIKYYSCKYEEESEKTQFY